MITLRQTIAAVLLLSTSASSAQQADGIDIASSLGQMVFGLVVVVAILFGSLWLIKRLSIPRGPASGLKLLGGIAIGSREKLILVEINNKVLVLGVTANQINTLHTLDAKELPKIDDATSNTRPDFSAWLKRSLEKRGRG